MIYLASPYSHMKAAVREQRYEAVRAFVAHMLPRAGQPLFSPIVYAHEMAKHHGIAGDFKTWESFNLGMLRISSQLWVLQLPQWDESAGVMAELDFAIRARIPYQYYSPNGAPVLC